MNTQKMTIEVLGLYIPVDGDEYAFETYKINLAHAKKSLDDSIEIAIENNTILGGECVVDQQNSHDVLLQLWLLGEDGDAYIRIQCE